MSNAKSAKEFIKEVDYHQYSYGCSRCNFNIHIKCAVLPIEAEFHDHPLTPFCKSITFTCDICGKEDKGRPYLCGPCSFWIHRRCASFPRRVKVWTHTMAFTIAPHAILLPTSIVLWSGETGIGRNLKMRSPKATLKIEDTKLGEFADSSAYKVKKTNVEKDGTEIATEIEHFSHKHDLKLSDDEVQNKEICNECVRAILPPFYSCVECSFFLHKSCAELPIKKRHPLHKHPLTLHPYGFVRCYAFVVVLKFPQYSVVPLVTLLWTLNALHYHIPQVTNNMSIPSLSVILLKMTLVNTTAIFVKKNETQSIGSTTVKIAVILLIQNVFLGNNQIASLGVLTHLLVIHTPLLSLRKRKTTLYVADVAVLVKS
uniref:DC1 domain-containing protein n=1 Tax=Fagus sylvatica TaxID=28930 RepID=A0A2N9IHF2_FAGSY